MPFCSNCGKEVKEDQDVCLSCGRALNPKVLKKVYDESESTVGYAVLGFFVPIVGLILYLIWMDERPKAAKSAGKGALISVIVYGAFFVLYFVFFFIMILFFGGLSFGFGQYLTMI
ncbi:MAG: zinc ribbon domain-containing protein [Acholeplasmataceae bacterium]|nr:zinc ribbon domain-containing protein [Acholeplasmataceae bacterium]